MPGKIPIDRGDSGLTDEEDVTAIVGLRVATAVAVMATGSAIPQTYRLGYTEVQGAWLDIIIDDVAERTQASSMTNRS